VTRSTRTVANYLLQSTRPGSYAIKMTDIDILTSLGVPATTNGPSLASLQWSEDGQAFILTRGAVYILVRLLHMAA
jgi:hypothetical protein